MTVVQYEPWTLVNRLQRRFDRALGDAFAAGNSTPSNVAWIPSVDVYEEADRYVVRADLPGVDAKDIEITAENGVLTLKGERHADKREQKDGYTRVERVAGGFVRRFTLPETVTTDAIKASQSNGVLELVIPKQPKPEPRRIKIEAA